jgi:hypothetical protein
MIWCISYSRSATCCSCVSDLAATAFAAKFYAAVAAGQSLKAAFAQGKLAVETVSINEADTPELVTAPGVNPAKIILT